MASHSLRRPSIISPIAVGILEEKDVAALRSVHETKATASIAVWFA